MGRYYAEVNSRSNLRGGVSGMYSLGDIASDIVAAATKAANAKLEGSGTASDPFGGMGGAWGNSSSGATAEKVLVQLTRHGIRFSALKPEDGLALIPGSLIPATTWGEKYAYATGSDGKFYKFRVNGSAFGRDTSNDKARYWFNDVVTAAKKQVASELVAKQLKEATKKAAIEAAKQKSKQKALARSGFTPDGLQLLQITSQDGESSLSTTGDGGDGDGGDGGGGGAGGGGGGGKLLLIGGAVAAVAVLYMFSRKG